MSSVYVKICGLREPDTMQVALDHGVDMVGLMCFAKSPRHVELSQMEMLADQARGKAQIAIVTVNATDEQLRTLNEVVRPDWWQLHGTEDAARIQAVQSQFGRPVMKALGIGDASDVDRANALMPVADRLLLDAKPPKDASRPGGLGTVFDWSLLDGLDQSKPTMLSGGLNPDNVRQAVAATGAWGVDVSSGVESEPGVKDAQKIIDFLSACQAANQPVVQDQQARTSA